MSSTLLRSSSHFLCTVARRQPVTDACRSLAVFSRPLTCSHLPPSERTIRLLPGRRGFSSSSAAVLAQQSLFGGPSGQGSHAGFFRKESLPANTIIRFVPQQTAWIVERMGKFHRILEPGLAILWPVIDKIKYVKSLKEAAIEIPSQSAITADNVTLEMDGVLYIRVFDAYKASYGVEDAEFAISQLAQTTMRSEIGQLTLDHVLKERAALNVNITHAINEASAEWGLVCLRYEIRDIHAPEPVLQAMHRMVSAERSKRAEILESEGQRQSAINVAEGKKQSVILASEAKKAEQINYAAGEAQAILVKADATARGIGAIAEAIGRGGEAAQGAVSLNVAEKYVEAFGRLAKESNTVVVPAQLGDLGGMIAGAMGIYGKVAETQGRTQRVLGERLEGSGGEETRKGSADAGSSIGREMLDAFDTSRRRG